MIVSGVPLTVLAFVTVPRSNVTWPPLPVTVGFAHTYAKLFGAAERSVSGRPDGTMESQPTKASPAGSVSATVKPGIVPSGTVTTTEYVRTSPMTTLSPIVVG